MRGACVWRSGPAPPKRRSRSPASWRSSCIACGATAQASGGRRRRSADDELNTRSAGGGWYLCRDDATVIPPALLERATLGRLRMQHWGGRSTNRHHGVDGVPTPERTVDPAAIGELAQPPAIREQSRAQHSTRPGLLTNGTSPPGLA